MDSIRRIPKSVRYWGCTVLVILMCPILMLYSSPTVHLASAMQYIGDLGHQQDTSGFRALRHGDVRSLVSYTDPSRPRPLPHKTNVNNHNSSVYASDIRKTVGHARTTDESLLGESGSFFSSKPQAPGVNVVLNARYRSGSSFTGEFFNRNEEFVYYFEPFHDINDGTPITSASTVNHVLQGLFDCSLRTKDLVGARPGSGWRQVVLCGLGKLCNNPDARQYSKSWDSRFKIVCKSRPHHAVKVIRVASIASLVPLMRRGVKVIHLIRDPRGIFMSRRGIILDITNHTEDTRRYCDTVLGDLEVIRVLYKKHGHDLQQALYMVRYEDLATQPLRYLYDIYTFLGVEPTRTVIDWAEDLQNKNDERRIHRTPKKNTRDIVSTVREEPTETAFAWRKRIPPQDLMAVQRVCAGLFEQLGYNVFRSRSESLNSSVPAMFDSSDILSDIVNTAGAPFTMSD